MLSEYIKYITYTKVEGAFSAFDYGFFHFFCSHYDKAAMMVLAKDRVSDRRISRIFKTTRQGIDNGYQQTSLS